MVLGVVGNDPVEDTGSAALELNVAYQITVPVDTVITHIEVWGNTGGSASTWRCSLRNSLPVPITGWATGLRGGDTNYIDIVNPVVDGRARGKLPTAQLVLAGQSVWVVAYRQLGSGYIFANNTATPAKLNASAVSFAYKTANLAITDFAVIANWNPRMSAYADGSSPAAAYKASLGDQLLAFYKVNVASPGSAKTLQDYEYLWLKQQGGSRPTNADMQMQLYSRVRNPLIPVGFTYV